MDMPLNVSESFVIDIAPDLLKDSPHIKSLARQLALKYVHREVVTEEDLKVVGGQLWAALGIGNTLDKAQRPEESISKNPAPYDSFG